MKKLLYFSLVLSLVFVTDFSPVFADITTPPVVSIGVGNTNTPENTGPVHNGIYHGLVPVYATISDDDLNAYHFRVIKDGGSQGHTCEGLGALYAPENQGYASTTLSRDACGFNFNQSVFDSSVGLENILIATLNTVDLAAFAGEGDYWLVIGAIDSVGNRTSVDYLQDPKIKITVDETSPLTMATVATTTITSPIIVSGTTTDAFGVVSVTLSSANFDGTSCGAFSPVTTLTANSVGSFVWSYDWTPTFTGNYCVNVVAQDVAGNVGEAVLVGTNLSYEAPAPVVPPTPAPVSGGGGGNGPVVGSYGFVSSGNIGLNTITIPTVITTSNTVVTEDTSVQNQVADAGNVVTSELDAEVTITPATDEVSITAEPVASSTQTAAVAQSGFNLNWLWAVLAVLILGGGAYFFNRNKA